MRRQADLDGNMDEGIREIMDRLREAESGKKAFDDLKPSGMIQAGHPRV